MTGRWTHKLEDRIGPTGVLAIMGLLPALGYLGLDRLGVAGGLLAASTFFIARGLGSVILTDALNSRVPSDFRATANSLTSFGFRGLFVATGPLVGFAFDLWGLGTTLLMLAALSLAIFASLIVPLIIGVRRIGNAKG